MKLISHRGNLDGPDPENENSPEKVLSTRTKGFDVEVDVWYDKKHGWWLGHDAPQYPVDQSILYNDDYDHSKGNVFFHAKNFDALVILSRMYHAEKTGNDCFWHQDDNYTLTKNGWIWAYPHHDVAINRAVIVAMPEYADLTYSDLVGVGGVCTDYPLKYKKETE